MRNYSYILILGLLGFIFGCGSLEKEIDLDLPEYSRPPVLECYLEPGQPYRALITKSSAYFDTFPSLDEQFLAKILEGGASVSILRGSEEIVLENSINFDAAAQKVYNYHTTELVPEDYDSEFLLKATLANGKTITASTQLVRPVPIDSVVVEFETDTSDNARILTYFFDDTTSTNFYRRILLDTLFESPDQDFALDDRLLNGVVAFGSGYEFERGDTVYNYLFHIDKPYYDFILSVFNARDANGNPFAQPSPIIGNLGGTAGAIGIFSGPGRTEEMTIVEE